MNLHPFRLATWVAIVSVLTIAGCLYASQVWASYERQEIRTRPRQSVLRMSAGLERPGSSAGPSTTERYEITQYSHGCVMPGNGQPEGHARRAANGRWPLTDISVAADTSIHPFGTELLIEGLGFRTVHDRGSAIRGKRLDIFVDSCREARRFGRQWLRVIVMPPASARYARGGMR